MYLDESNESNKIITLTTDFGLRDPYVAEMKAIMLGISPNSKIVDISHEIEKFNLTMAGYTLAAACPYFPKGTIHVAVIDPGVGTSRKAILIHTENSYYIGPDNGALILAAKAQRIRHTYRIENPKFMLSRISSTFHGRDIFAPAAAHLANGIPAEEFGPETTEIVKPRFAEITKINGELIGEVIHIDDFGNIITNLGERELRLIGIKRTIRIDLEDTNLQLQLFEAYAEADSQEPFAIIGSHNFLEISINQGNAAKRIQARVGDKITLFRNEKP